MLQHAGRALHFNGTIEVVEAFIREELKFLLIFLCASVGNLDTHEDFRGGLGLV